MADVSVTSSSSHAVSTGWNGASFDWTQAITVPTGTTVLSVMLVGQINNPPTFTYGGVAFTVRAYAGDGNSNGIHIFDIDSPVAGTADIYMNTEIHARTYRVLVKTIAGTDLTNPRGTPARQGGWLSSVSLTSPTLVGALVIDAISILDIETATEGAGQAVLTDYEASRGTYVAYSSSEVAVSNLTEMSWGISGVGWVIAASISYNPAIPTYIKTLPLPKVYHPDFRNPRVKPVGPVELTNAASSFSRVMLAGQNRDYVKNQKLVGRVSNGDSWYTGDGFLVGTDAPIEQGNFCIAASFVWEGANGLHHQVVGKRDSWSPTAMQWQLVRSSAGTWRFQHFGDLIDLGALPSIVEGIPTTLVITCDGTVTNVFVNGALVNGILDSLIFGTGTASALRIGDDNTASDFNGKIYAVALGSYLNNVEAEALSRDIYGTLFRPATPQRYSFAPIVLTKPYTLPKIYHPDFRNPRVKPTGPVEIDWSNPISDALMFLWINGSTDLVSGRTADISNSYIPRNITEGQFQSPDGTMEWSIPPEVDFTKSLSIVTTQATNVNIASSVIPHAGLTAGSTITFGFLGGGFLGNGGKVLGRFARQTSPYPLQITGVDLYAEIPAKVLSISSDSVAEVVHFYVDGVNTTTQTNAWGGLDVTTDRVRVGRGGGQAPSHGIVAIFNRQLTDAEHLEFGLNPYLLLKPKTSPQYFIPDSQEILRILTLPKIYSPDFRNPRVKPIGPVEIDFTKTITEGLKFLYVPQGPNDYRDLVSGQVGTPSNITQGIDVDGWASIGAGAGQILFPNVKHDIGIGSFTMITLFKYEDGGTDTWLTVMSLPNNSYIGMYLPRNNTQLWLASDTTSSATENFSTLTVVDKELALFTLKNEASGTLADGWKNDKFQAGAANPSNYLGGGDTGVTLFGGQGAEFGRGRLYAAALFNRLLSDGEQIELSRGFYQALLKPAQPMQYMVVSNLSASAITSGTYYPTLTEALAAAGPNTIILTLVGDTWIPI